MFFKGLIFRNNNIFVVISKNRLSVTLGSWNTDVVVDFANSNLNQ